MGNLVFSTIQNNKSVDLNKLVTTCNISKYRIAIKLIRSLSFGIIYDEEDMAFYTKMSYYLKEIFETSFFNKKEKEKLQIKFNELKSIIESQNNDFIKNTTLANDFNKIKNIIFSIDISSKKKPTQEILFLEHLIKNKHNIFTIINFIKNTENKDFTKNKYFINFYNSFILNTINKIDQNYSESLYNILIIKLFNCPLLDKELLLDFINQKSKLVKNQDKHLLNDIKAIINGEKTSHTVLNKYNVKNSNILFNFNNFEEKIKNTNTVITIDRSTDQTYKDDGLSLTHDGDNLILGIHISDVSSYINNQTIEYNELCKKHRTMYLDREVIHLFYPSKEMNNLSLNTENNTNSISLYVVLSNTGEIKDYYIVNDKIHITKNFTYDEVNRILNNKNIDELSPYLLDINNAIKLMRPVLPEKLIDPMDSIVVPPSIISQNNTPAHKLIEDSMILYNHLIAKTMNEENLPFIYRNQQSSKDTLLNYSNLSDQEQKYLLHSLYLCPNYSLENKGHHGLNKSAYSHTTCPLRRIPDIENQFLIHGFLLNNQEYLRTQKELEMFVNSLNQRNYELKMCELELALQRNNNNV